MKNIKIICLFNIVLFISASFSQKGKESNADKKYDQFNYVDAIKTYERIANKGYKSEDLFQKLANSYYFSGELAKANKYYTELFDLNQNQEPEYYYRFSQCLKSIENYKKADEMLVQFNIKSANDERGKLFVNNKNYLNDIKKKSSKYIIENLNVNSKFLDYGSAYYGDKLVFATAKETDDFLVRKSDWNDQSFMNLYQANIKADGTLEKPEKLKNINSRFHECSAIFTKGGNTMYFTRNNFSNGKKGKSSNKTILLKLFKSLKIDNKWSDAIELPFNSNQYSTAHASLSQDEKTLYFSSDMPGTIGQSDIWKVTIINENEYGKPENLGKIINTEGRETFPFINNENQLYFATDGQQGLGGLDIYYSDIDKNGNFTSPKNIGLPVNSNKDDFAFLLDSKNQSGYFSSNREGGKGFDDIYKFNINPIKPCVQELIGIVTDKDSGEILTNTEVVILDNKFKEIAKIMSDENGKYHFDVNCGESYYVRATKPDYETNEQKIVIPTETGITDLPIKLEKKLKPIKPGDDLAKTFGIKLIYFDLDKSNIRKDAAIELEKILDVMKQNPNMSIDVRSHTDSRASFEYNEKLSDRRVKSSIAWLIKNGISSEKLSGRGYGESIIINQCSDGVKCTEAEHQLNRRSEFIIISK